MLRHRQAVTLCGLLGLVLAACGSTAKTGTGTSPATTARASASQCTTGTGLTKTATTASYTMVLDANASEAMYTQAQVAAQHPKAGEVMLRGQMNAMAGSGAADSSTTMMGSATTMAGTPMADRHNRTSHIRYFIVRIVKSEHPHTLLLLR